MQRCGGGKKGNSEMGMEEDGEGLWLYFGVFRGAFYTQGQEGDANPAKEVEDESVQ